MILKEFSDYIKSREALAESVSTSTADADKSGIFGNSAGAAGSTAATSVTDSASSSDATSTTKSTDAAGEAGAAGLTDAEKTTDFSKNGKTLPPQVKLSDGDSSTVFADSNTTANAKTSGAGAPDPTNATKTEERGKMLQNSREVLSTTDSEETRGDSGKDPVSRGVRQAQKTNFSCVKLLNEWLVKKLRSVPISNVDKIICNELFLATNKRGATLIIAKRESGRKLLRALYNFSLSYEHYRFARRTHEVRPSNFTNRKD